MDNNNLKLQLIESLEKIYYMDAFSQMVEFLQGELYLLNFLAVNSDEEFGPSELSEKLHILLNVKLNNTYILTLFKAICPSIPQSSQCY